MAVTPYPTLPATLTDYTTVDASADINAVINAQKNGPQGLLTAPATLTANGPSVTTVQTASGLTITTTPPAGRWLKITVDGYMSSTVGADSSDVWIVKDGTNVAHTVALCSGSTRFAIVFWDNPTNASHTYRVDYKRNAGTGTHSMLGSAVSGFVQPYLSIDDTGAA